MPAVSAPITASASRTTDRADPRTSTRRALSSLASPMHTDAGSRTRVELSPGWSCAIAYRLAVDCLVNHVQPRVSDLAVGLLY